MSSVNVIPSAPEYTETLYPSNEITQISAEDFRLKKISDLQTELKNEADHYRQVAKKYKKTHNITHISAVGLDSLSAGLSSTTLATALTGFGIVASPALAGAAAVFGLLSAGFTVVSKRLERKVTKHEKIYTLALAKLNSVYELTSKALADNRISDSEFSIILRGVEKYHELKAAIRDGEKQTQISNKETQIQPPDLDKIKGEQRNQTRVSKKDRTTNRSLHGGKLVFSANLKRQDTPLLNISDPFLAETVEYWSTLNYSEDNLNFPSSQIWLNSLIRIDNKPFYYMSWFHAGVKDVKD